MDHLNPKHLNLEPEGSSNPSQPLKSKIPLQNPCRSLKGAVEEAPTVTFKGTLMVSL